NESGPEPFDRLDDQLLQAVFPVANQEYIDPDTACAETMFLQLRLLDGMDLQQASASVGTDLAEKYREEIKDLIELGLLQQHGYNLRLASSAYLIANQVFTRFV
ncbi:MAG: coproporphyrinogen III oxidase, partial [Chloroflexi bacterium]|nr:coproporphyrinogen III oxidase [Chloroflexota bacterium]MCI0896491.1 coproporphyrinogen III oxidase [Chloroflexota bacterium]